MNTYSMLLKCNNYSIRKRILTQTLGNKIYEIMKTMFQETFLKKKKLVERKHNYKRFKIKIVNYTNNLYFLH